MKIAIGLPAAVPGTTPAQLTDFARRADTLGFSSLGVIDRLVYPNYEPLTLAAAAAVTESIDLLASIVIGPPRNPAVLAKEALSINALSGGRRTLGSD